MTDPIDILELARRQRQALQQRDAAVLVGLVERWQSLGLRLAGEVDKLFLGAPAELPPGWLYARSRLAILETIASMYVRQEVQQLTDTLAAARLAAAQQGALDVAALLGRVDAVVQLQAALTVDAPLARLLESIAPGLVREVSAALVQGVALGQAPAVIARRVRSLTGQTAARALTLVRTETLKAYRVATLESYRQQPDIVTGWIWLATLGARTCAMCLAMHGTRHPLSEPFASHPNCRCTMIPIVAELPPVEAGSAWFARQPRATQLAVLGPGKLAAYESGQLTLDDLVGESTSAAWGPGRYERPLKEITA